MYEEEEEEEDEVEKSEYIWVQLGEPITFW